MWELLCHTRAFKPFSFFILAEATQMGKSFSKLEKFVEKGL